MKDDQEGPCLPIWTIQSVMKKSVTSSVLWIPQRNNWKQSDSLSAQLGEKQCSYLRKKGLKTNLNLLSSEPSICLNEESPPFNYKLAEVVNHHSKCCALQSYNKKSSGLFSRGGTPCTSWTIVILLHPAHSSALVCWQRSPQSTWLTRGSVHYLSQGHRYEIHFLASDIWEAPPTHREWVWAVHPWGSISTLSLPNTVLMNNSRSAPGRVWCILEFCESWESPAHTARSGRKTPGAKGKYLPCWVTVEEITHQAPRERASKEHTSIDQFSKPHWPWLRPHLGWQELPAVPPSPAAHLGTNSFIQQRCCKARHAHFP